MATTPFDAAAGVLGAFDTNQRINEIVLESISDDVWHQPRPFGRGRNIADTFAHMHTARLMWLKVIAPRAPKVAKCDGDTATRAEVAAALRASHDALATVVRDALAGDGQVKHFTAGAVSFVAYFMMHEAHHRGQIAMLAKALGAPLPNTVSYGIWDWNALTKEKDAAKKRSSRS